MSHTRATIERLIPDSIGFKAQCACEHTYLATVNVLLVEHVAGCITRYALLGYAVAPDEHRDAQRDDDAGDDPLLMGGTPPSGILTDEGRALVAKGDAADAEVDDMLSAEEVNARWQHILEQLNATRSAPAAPADRPRGHADRLAECVSKLNDAILDASVDGLHVECAYTQSDLVTGQVTLIDIVRVSRSVAAHGALASGALARHAGR